MTMHEIQTIGIEDAVYPAELKKISDAPKVLYFRGTLPHADELCIAIVGTRRPSPYGQQSALHLAGELADAGLTIVSGMAPGIDTYAHRICIEKKTRTIAVLGTGLDATSIYPQENVRLAEKIIEMGGCLISEFEPGTHGSKFTFPKRNRIISALSVGVVVIEAKEKSGSLLTAQYAKKQGKKLFAVPGQIFMANAAGPHHLIKEGATLVHNTNDIIEELKMIRLPIKKVEKQLTGNSNESLILQALQEESLTIDKVIERTRLPAHTVVTHLALLEISGTIRNLGGNTYSIA
jgi:DNA processing protein